MNKKTKLKWIQALNELYDQYQKEAKTFRCLHIDTICPLCKLAYKIKQVSGNISNICPYCIHTNTKFGQGIRCTDQASYMKVANPFSTREVRRRAMLYRASYIKKLREKLEKSL